MRVLAACSLGGAGHLRPLLPLLDSAQTAGHEVQVTGPPALAELVREAGHRFRAGGEPPESVIAPIREQLPVLPPGEAAALGNRELFGRLATEAMLPDMDAICREWRPDLVLREPCEYSSAVVAHRLGLAVAQVGISAADTEWDVISLVEPVLAEHGGDIADAIRRAPYVTGFPATLDRSPFPITLRYRDASAGEPAPLPDWWGGSTAPLVYLTFGTVLGYMTIAPAVYRTALAALADLDVRVLLTVGRHFDTSALGELPSNVHVEPWVDQRRALAAAELVVCHGGSGTVCGALAAGVPVVTAPVFADQFDNGRRLAAAGAGLTIEPDEPRSRVVSPEEAPRVRAGVTHALTAPEQRRRARELAAEMAAAPEAGTLLVDLLGHQSLTGRSAVRSPDDPVS